MLGATLALQGSFAAADSFAFAPLAVEDAEGNGRAGDGFLPDDELFIVPEGADFAEMPECDPLAGDFQAWTCQFLPDGILYPAYLAGAKESRMAGALEHLNGEGWIIEATIGGRVGLLRYGTRGDDRPQGWQLDLEGACFPRLDLEEKWDLTVTDFRIGLPLTYALGSWEYKLAAYHLSSHIGDEYLIKNPGFQRINYSRDVLVLGGAYRLLDAVRLYAEAGWAFNTSGGSRPWEFQSGVDYSPLWTARRGSPFAAFNAHLREESDFGGHVTLQAGWQWRGDETGHLLRLGVEYLNGKSPQFEIFTRNEERLGLGVWYDY